MFQFTRPRGARRNAAQSATTAEQVSIHAPARGATKLRQTRPQSRCCFNSRAREGRDKIAVICHRFNCSFNSRAREGRDKYEWQPPEGISVVSIHAPARGATLLIMSTISTLKFQFTRPRGARPLHHEKDFVIQNGFNSRAREGRDSMGFYLPIFICLQRFFCETFLFFYFYIHFRIVILRNLLNINMCESPGFFCALGVRLRKFALLFYHRLQVR